MDPRIGPRCYLHSLPVGEPAVHRYLRHGLPGCAAAAGDLVALHPGEEMAAGSPLTAPAPALRLHLTPGTTEGLVQQWSKTLSVL